MRLTLIASLLVLSTPAAAWNYCTYGAPPLEFQFEPVASYKIYDMPMDLLPAVCGVEWRPPRWAAACTQEVAPGMWFIWVRNDVGEQERDCLLVHEKAHINGWKHPDSDSTRGPHQRRTGAKLYEPLP